MTPSDTHPQNYDTSVILPQLREIASAVMYAAEAGKLEVVLERIAQVSQDLVNARFAALGVPDGRGGLRYFKTTGLTPEEHSRLTHLPRGNGLIGAIMQERKAIRLERMQDDERSIGFCKAHPQMTSLLGVPILIGQQLLGTLYLCDRIDGKPFDERDEWIIETMAGYAAVAIAGSQLNDQQRRLTLLEERERIGMELHDGIIQSLYAIGMHLDLIRHNDTQVTSELTETIDNLNHVIEDIRLYIHNLHGERKNTTTIRECFEEILSRLHTPDTLSVQLNAGDETPPFSPTVFEAICQMANEAISNAVRHSGATVIRIDVEEVGYTFQCVVEDNGNGFSPDATSKEGGLGLRNLHQRALLHGGRIEIDSVPGSGTRLAIIIPLRAM
ncbi:MAG: GAF domain-containing sensor histidine kinase [Anaerolineae bacterium]|nr:GAF domain-containing sensor histidine kinase [Anaerolineae bacterium]